MFSICIYLCIFNYLCLYLPTSLSTYLSPIYLLSIFSILSTASARWLRKNSHPSYLNRPCDILLKTQRALWVRESISQFKRDTFPYSKVPSATPVQMLVLFGRIGGVLLWNRLISLSILRASLVAKLVKSLPAAQETRVRLLGREDPLEKAMETHSSILVWKIPWTEESNGLQSVGWQRVRHDWAANFRFTFRIGGVS